MGRTLPSFTQLIIGEQDALAKFRRALRKQDQRAFDDLFRAARYHVAAAAYASHLLPFETMLLAMLIEEHKRVQHLEALLERLLGPHCRGEWGIVGQMADEQGEMTHEYPADPAGPLRGAQPLEVPGAYSCVK